MQQKPTQQEIQKTLKLHSLWLQDNTKGEQADFSNKDLSYATLSGANLSWADLSWANLIDANLIDANLSHATLRSANLSGAKYNEKTTWPKASMVVSAYWPNETKEIEALVSPMIQKLLSKHLVLEQPKKTKTQTKESCDGKVVEIDGIEYILKRK